MRRNVTLNSERLTITPLTSTDAAGYSQLGVSYRSTGPINTEEKARQYIKKSQSSDDSFDLGIYLDGELIGTIEVCHMKWFTKGCEICYTIREDKWGQGYATEAVREVLNYLFKEMDMHKIYADTEPENIGSQRVLEKCGFKLEGTIRDRQFKNGKWVDELAYGLLREEHHA